MVRFPTGAEGSLLSKTSRPPLESIQPFVQWAVGALFPGGGGEAVGASSRPVMSM